MKPLKLSDHYTLPLSLCTKESVIPIAEARFADEVYLADIDVEKDFLESAVEHCEYPTRINSVKGPSLSLYVWNDYKTEATEHDLRECSLRVMISVFGEPFLRPLVVNIPRFVFLDYNYTPIRDYGPTDLLLEPDSYLVGQVVAACIDNTNGLFGDSRFYE